MKCPHCSTAFAENIGYHDFAQSTEAWKWQMRHTCCAACGKLIVKLARQDRIDGYDDSGQLRQSQGGDWTEWMVYPKGTTRGPIPPEIPAGFAEDYREACLVLDDSPKASAALSRRCLQNILREKAGTKHSNLFNEIQEVLDNGQLPSYLADDIDAIRNIGNFAAHPVKSQNTGAVMPVEPGEAEWNLDVVEGLFDFYFVAPARAQKKRDALNQKLREAGKNPMK